MKKVPGKYFWLLMTITGALMFGAPALVSASEGIASTDTENSAADNAADTPDDDTIAKTTDSAEKNSVVHLDTSVRKPIIQERDRSPNLNISKMQKITEKKLSPMKTRQIILMDTTRLWVEQLFPSMKCVHYTTVRDALTHLKNSVAAEHLI